MKCTIRGHAHKLNHIRNVVQQGTGLVAHIYECPEGRYRWMYIPNVTKNIDNLRMRRPRWGWKD